MKPSLCWALLSLENKGEEALGPPGTRGRVNGSEDGPGLARAPHTEYTIHKHRT